MNLNTAEKYFEKAYKLFPLNKLFLLNYSSILTSLNKKKNAIKICNNFLLKNKDKEVIEYLNNLMNKDYISFNYKISNSFIPSDTNKIQLDTNKKVIAYILKRFPCLSETFILNEILELEKKKTKIIIFSLYTPYYEITHPQFSKLKSEIIYVKKNLYKENTNELNIENEYNYFKNLNYNNYKKLNKIFYNLNYNNELLKMAYWICNKASTYNISHFHAHFGHEASTIAYLCKLISNISFSITLHAKFLFSANSNDYLFNKKLSAAKDIITVTKYNYRYIIQKFPDLNPEKIHVVNNGINLNFIKLNYKERKHNNLILAIGRLIPKKGFNYLIEACKILKDLGIIFKCKIVGEGEEQNNLEKKIITLDLSNEVKLIGPVSNDEVISLMHEASVFCLPSTVDTDGNMDAFPTVILEAMATGLPVISTNISGIPEIIQNEKNGILINPDDPIELANQIYNLLINKNLYKKISTNAHKKIIECFNINETIIKFINIIDNNKDTINKNNISYPEKIFLNITKKSFLNRILYNVFYKNKSKKRMIEKNIKNKNNYNFTVKNNKTLNIIFIINNFPKTYFVFIINEIIELIKLGHNIVIASLNKPNNYNLPESFYQYNLYNKIIYFNPEEKELIYGIIYSKNNVSNLNKISNYDYLSDKFKSFQILKQYDIIHAAFCNKSATIALILSKILNMPFTFEAHAYDIFVEFSLISEKINSAKKIFTISNYNKDYLINKYNCSKSKISVKRVTFNKSFCDYLNSIEKKNKDDNLIITVARLHPIKGLEYAIEAIKLLSNDNIKLKYIIIGDGILREKLQEKVKQKKLNNIIVFKGEMKNEEVLKLIKKASIFLLPSIITENGDRDGIPTVMLEAMYQKTPVISSNISGIPELIKNGKNGFLTDPKNVNQIADTIKILLENKKLRIKMGEEAKLTVEKKFNISKNINVLVKEWNKIKKGNKQKINLRYK